ncbi:MAG: sugar phosphate isomerase/epimerase [Clostridia bacterium]|nr:sugar phosphate isomerase/epimerase [Clostridia bacterium]
MNLGIITGHDPAGIKYVRDLGLGYAEFDVNGDDISYLTDADKSDAVLEAMKKYDVKLGAVGRWGRFRINNDGTISEKERQDEYDLIDLCRKLGCPVYICGVNYVDGLSYYENITAAINYIQSLIEYAGEDVKVCTYNCHWHSYVDTPKAWELIHGHLKSLGIKFDPSHTINGGRDYIREMVDWGDRFYHVHLKGTINVDGIHVDDPPAGMDMINWGMFLSLLRAKKYDGMLSIEPHSATWQGELGAKGVEFTVKYFKKMLFEE